MAPAKIIDRTSPAVIPAGSPPMRASRLPPYLRLPVLLVLNLGISMVFWSYASPFLGNELGSVSKSPDEENNLAPWVRVLYKLGVIGAGWWLHYDYMDIAALTAITSTPHAYLLSTYFSITPLTVAANVVNEILAIAIPTWLLRSRSAVNNPNVPLRSRYLLNSSQVNFANTLLAVGVYVVVLFSTFQVSTFRSFLVTNLEVPTLEGAYAETTFSLATKLLLAGVATKHFLLNPSLGATPPGDATPVEVFNPATASLPQTFKHNFWFFSRRTRTLIQQTATVSFFLLTNTVKQGMSLKGTTFVGLAGYSGVWIFANLICAGWWAWIGDAEL